MSRKSHFYRCRVVFLLFLQIHGLYSSNSKSVFERFRYLERRINTESKFRDEDFLDIIERLDGIDRKLNKTLEDRTSTGEKTEKTVNNDYSEIVENLHSEKYHNERIRRQIPKIENNLTSVKADLQEYCLASIDKTEKTNSSIQETLQKLSLKVKESAESVKTDMAKHIEKMNSSIQESVQKLSIKVEETVEVVRSEEAKKIEEVQSSVQDTVQKLLAQEADKLLKISKKVENTESLVMNLSNILLQTLSNSCLELKKRKTFQSGIYTLRNGKEVYCDQTTGKGGWTVFQRRLNGAVDFYRTWDEYKTGFGDLDGEFWLGNELLSKLTADGDHELRIDMEDFEGNKAYAKYSKFRIHGVDDMYRLKVSGFSGNAGDSLDYHNGMQFTTSDTDNDESSINCAQDYSGAWWYKGCYFSNLNGKYYNEPGKSTKGINWYHWKQKYYCLKTVEMKFR